MGCVNKTTRVTGGNQRSKDRHQDKDNQDHQSDNGFGLGQQVLEEFQLCGNGFYSVRAVLATRLPGI